MPPPPSGPGGFDGPPAPAMGYQGQGAPPPPMVDQQSYGGQFYGGYAPPSQQGAIPNAFDSMPMQSAPGYPPMSGAPMGQPVIY